MKRLNHVRRRPDTFCRSLIIRMSRSEPFLVSGQHHAPGKRPRLHPGLRRARQRLGGPSASRYGWVRLPRRRVVPARHARSTVGARHRGRCHRAPTRRARRHSGTGCRTPAASMPTRPRLGWQGDQRVFVGAGAGHPGQPARDAQPGLVEPDHLRRGEAIGDIVEEATQASRSAPGHHRDRAFRDRVPNNSASAWAARFLDRDCPT